MDTGLDIAGKAGLFKPGNRLSCIYCYGFLTQDRLFGRLGGEGDMHTAAKKTYIAARQKIFHNPYAPGRLQLQNFSPRIHLKNYAAAESRANYSFHQAGLLDIPFIVYLIAKGSREGSFPAYYSTPKGLAGLSWVLINDILRPYRFANNGICGIETLIFTKNNQDIGFMEIGRISGGSVHVIKYCAIAEQHRNQNHGSQMIRMYAGKLPAAAQIVAYCTKVNLAMPHVLEKLGFQKEPGFESDCYRLTKY